MSTSNDPVMQLAYAIVGGELTSKQRVALALLVHGIGAEDPSEQDRQAAAWKWTRRDFAKLLDSYQHPDEPDDTREA